MSRKFAEQLAISFDLYPLYLVHFPPEDINHQSDLENQRRDEEDNHER